MEMISSKQMNRVEAGIISLLKLGERIMTQVTDFVAAQQVFITAINKAISDITTEIATLNTTIATLQTGGLSTSDAASLNTLSTSVQGIAGALQTIDTANAPTTPVTTPPAAS
jgi:hypothetical protein